MHGGAGFDRRHPLALLERAAQHVLHRAPALGHVAAQAADQPQVGVGVDVDLEVEQLAQVRHLEEQITMANAVDGDREEEDRENGEEDDDGQDDEDEGHEQQHPVEGDEPAQRCRSPTEREVGEERHRDDRREDDEPGQHGTAFSSRARCQGRNGTPSPSKTREKSS